jgi:hypothetical protein
MSVREGAGTLDIPLGKMDCLPEKGDLFSPVRMTVLAASPGKEEGHAARFD